MDQKRYFFSFFLFVKILCDSLRLLDSQLFDRLTDAAISSENTQRSEPKSLNVPVVVFIFVCIVVVIYLCCRCPPHLPVLLMFWENCPRCHWQGFDRSWAVLGRHSRCLILTWLWFMSPSTYIFNKSIVLITKGITLYNHIQGVFFKCPPPQFQYQKENR